jgi:hypothetical protein
MHIIIIIIIIIFFKYYEVTIEYIMVLRINYYNINDFMEDLYSSICSIGFQSHFILIKLNMKYFSCD